MSEALPHPEALNMALDKALLLDLVDLVAITEHNNNIYCSTVLAIMLGELFGERPENKQTVIAHALFSIDNLLETIETHRENEIENPGHGAVAGLLTCPFLLRMRSNFHGTMGNHKKAIKDLNKALKIDENYTKARQKRVNIWEAKDLKDAATIFAEYTRILNEVHEDNDNNDEIYASLAIIIMANPTLGTMDDAKMHYEKCLRAQMRRSELYGRRMKEDEPPVLHMVRDMYAERQNPELPAFSLRKELNDVRQGKKEKSSSVFVLRKQILRRVSTYSSYHSNADTIHP